MKKIKINKGITLVALIITVIILLILAGITISQLAGNGIFEKVKQAKQKYENTQEIENRTLQEYETQIDSYRDTVTISKEEYETLKPKSISSNSLLLTSTNSTKTKTTTPLNLTSFTNNFEEGYNTYFTYNETTGTLTCAKSGWYFFDIQVQLANNSGDATHTVNTKINNIEIATSRCQATSGAAHDKNSNSFSIFISSGDTIDFEKTNNVAVSHVSADTIRIFHL